jgi:hypothetical protein
VTGMSGRYGVMPSDGRAYGSSDGRSGCKGTVQWDIATGAVACMHDAWLQRERLVDKVGSKRVQWVLASDVGPWLQADIEAQHCL